MTLTTERRQGILDDMYEPSADRKREFGARLSYLRQHQGLSLRGLGDVIGVTGEAVRLWEIGQHSPSQAVARRLGEFFEDDNLAALLGYPDHGTTSLDDLLAAILARLESIERALRRRK